MSRKNFVEKVTGQLSELNKLNFVNSFKPSYTVIWVANMFISIIFIHSLTITNNDPRVRNIELFIFSIESQYFIMILSKIMNLMNLLWYKMVFSVYLRICIKKYTWVNFVWLKNTSTLIVIWRVDWKYLLINWDNTQHFRQIRSPFIKWYIIKFNCLMIFQFLKLPWWYISNYL